MHHLLKLQETFSALIKMQFRGENCREATVLNDWVDLNTAYCLNEGLIIKGMFILIYSQGQVLTTRNRVFDAKWTRIRI